LRTQARHAPPHRFALRHWRNRRHGDVGAGLMKNTPGHRACQRLVPSGIRDDGRGRRVRALGRQQRRPAALYRTRVPTMSHIDIQCGGPLQYSPVMRGTCL
jgi:hypothetical protein